MTIHNNAELYIYHKKHHEIKNTISLTSEYNGIVEEILNWTISSWLFCFIFRMDFYFNIIYILFNTFYGVVGHSGYNFPLFGNDIKKHYLHHKYYNCNYSGYEPFDVFFKTNRKE